MELIKEIGRHGDLSFRKVEKEIKGKRSKSVVLAEGEFTGHFHRLTATEGASVTLLEENGEMFFAVEGGNADLSHEEHNTITFKEGTYKVIHEREHDYFLEESRRVLD